MRCWPAIRYSGLLRIKAVMLKTNSQPMTFENIAGGWLFGGLPVGECMYWGRGYVNLSPALGWWPVPWRGGGEKVNAKTVPLSLNLAHKLCVSAACLDERKGVQRCFGWEGLRCVLFFKTLRRPWVEWSFSP